MKIVRKKFKFSLDNQPGACYIDITTRANPAKAGGAKLKGLPFGGGSQLQTILGNVLKIG